MNPRPSDARLDEDARRVAACLHACEGIPTEALESQVILRLVAACVSLRDVRLREVLEEMSIRPPGAEGRSRRRNLRALPGPRAGAPREGLTRAPHFFQTSTSASSSPEATSRSAESPVGSPTMTAKSFRDSSFRVVRDLRGNFQSR